jgi:hypothetical protein
MKPIDVLRRLFGPDLEAGEPGDTIVLDGPEEPSGRIGFTLLDKDGKIRRCGVTPAVIDDCGDSRDIVDLIRGATRF